MEIEALFGAAIQVKVPIALWRSPGKEKINGLIELSEKASPKRIEFESEQAGFAFSPFINPHGEKTLFLNADMVFDTASGAVVKKREIKKDVEKEKRKNHLFKMFHHFLDCPEMTSISWYNNETPPETQSARMRYCKLVADGIKAIQNRRFRKLVLSRTKVVPLTDDFNAVQMFKKLCKGYPDAFVSLVSIPGVGTWMGASPEILVSLNKNHIFRTVSLAGTLKAGDGVSSFKEPVWTTKEFEEQAWVSRYIVRCFNRMGLEEFEEEGPRTVRAGNLFHLRTDFAVDMKALKLPHFSSTMLKLLHPTPAVCGLPKGEALAYILENEGYDREFYTGFLGPVNMANESHLFVNLRCLQLYKRQAILYVGAGITGESVPEMEWQETEMKCDTLLRVMAGK